MIELNNLKLLAQGGQAKIYELDENRILRVLRNKYDDANLRTEMSVMNSLRKKGKDVPKVYDYLTIDEMPAVIVERLHGDSMMEEMKKKPAALFKNAEMLAKLHTEITGPADGLELMSLHQRAASLIPMAEQLTEELKSFALEILSGLPEGNDICHGDFHPGNIIIQHGKYYVFDWFGVTSGRKLSDFAHTYLLFRNTPRLDHVGKIENFINSRLGSLLAARYIKTCHKLYSFEWEEFSRWLVIRASERVFYGRPSEKPALIMFLNKCRNAYNAGLSPKIWWKYI